MEQPTISVSISLDRRNWNALSDTLYAFAKGRKKGDKWFQWVKQINQIIHTELQKSSSAQVSITLTETNWNAVQSIIQSTYQNSAAEWQRWAYDLIEKIYLDIHSNREWEYKDYVYNWQNNQIIAYKASRFTYAQIRLSTWTDFESHITSGLQKLTDDGWEPIGTVGPSNIKLHEYTKFNMTSWLISCLVTLGGSLLLFFLFNENWVIPVEFRVRLRRHISLSR